jgi:uncharacterized protein (TIGR04255 family)
MNVLMGDLFPPSPRVLYRKAPLVQVTCQLRFPPVLRIEVEPPVAFQDKVRGSFPLFERVGVPLLPPGLPPEIAQSLAAQLGQAAPSSYQFHTEDKSTTIVLASESFSISTRSYRTWEGFLKQLREPLSSLMAIYNPNFFSRIGLRYQDFINRELIGIGNTPWTKLLKPEIVGELALPDIEQRVLDARRVLRVGMSMPGATLLLQHGLSKPTGSTEFGYTMDFDFYTEQRTGVKDAETTLNGLHEGVGRAFRWCITDRLHDALDPANLSSTDLDDGG